MPNDRDQLPGACAGSAGLICSGLSSSPYFSLIDLETYSASKTKPFIWGFSLKQTIVFVALGFDMTCVSPPEVVVVAVP